MRGTKPSRTAQGVAAERALLTEMGVLDDPFARDLLGPTMSALYRVARRWPHRVPTLAVTLAGLATRVLWHDRQVTDALDSGIAQVVTIGAGYDSRAWRFTRDGVRFFELDLPGTQDLKRRLMPEPGPSFVSADLRVDDAADGLAAAGLDASRPVLLVFEGVTMYLTEEIVRRQLSGLRELCAPGSRMSVDFYPPPDAGTGVDSRQNRVQRLARAGSGERLRLEVDRGAAVALVESCGWQVTEALGARAAAGRFLPSSSELPVNEVNDQKTLVAAVVRT